MFASIITVISLGLAATWFMNYIGRNEPPEMVDVLIASQDIKPGTVLRDPQKLLKSKRLRKDEEPQNALKLADIASLKDKRVIKALSADQVCTQSDLNDNFSQEASRGMRAVTIQLTSEQAAGGNLLPNSRVDIVLISHDALRKPEMVIQSIRVLAVNNTGQSPEHIKSSTPMIITLEMSPDDMLKFSTAKELGRLELILRSNEDTVSIPHVPRLETEQVWVAAKKLDAGQKLENIDELLKKKLYIREELPVNAINNIDLLKNKTLSRVVDADKFFTEEDFKQIIAPHVLGLPPLVEVWVPAKELVAGTKLLNISEQLKKTQLDQVRLPQDVIGIGSLELLLNKTLNRTVDEGELLTKLDFIDPFAFAQAQSKISAKNNTAQKLAMKTGHRIRRVYNEKPDIALVGKFPGDPSTVIVTGKSLGKTRILMIDIDGKEETYEVNITPER